MNWETPNQWKKRIKLLLGVATIWPVVYIFVFVFSMFSMVIFLPFATEQSDRHHQDIDLIQLEHKVRDGQLKQLTITDDRIISYDRIGNETYDTRVTNNVTRAEILQEAREIDEKTCRPRVDLIEEKSTPELSPLFPIGFASIFALHMLTILLSMALIPIYIVLAVKSVNLDQTTRIVWVVLICMMGMMAMPVYWYLYVWRKAPPANPQLSAGTPRSVTEEPQSAPSYVPPSEPPDWR